MTNTKQANGARPKKKVPSENMLSPDSHSQVMQCEEDLLTMQPESPNQTMLIPGRSDSIENSPHNSDPFDFSVPAPKLPPPQTRREHSQSALASHHNILRKKPTVVNPPDLIQANGIAIPSAQGFVPASRNHLKDARRSQSAIIPGGDIFENNEDIYNESLPHISSGMGSVGRSFTAPAGYRYSTGQILFGNTPSSGIGVDEPLPSPQEWTSQALRTNNRPEPIGSSNAVENRHRPHARASQPRPLNIDRNVDDDNHPAGQQLNESTNVNLYPGEAKDKNQTAELRKPELMNNDPLVTSNKVIPRRNIYTEDTRREGRLEGTDLVGGDYSACPVCSQEYPVSDLQQHVSDCLPDEDSQHSNSPPRAQETERVCPMCSETFDNVLSQADFEAHVNRHFGDETLDNFEVLSHP